MDGDQRGGAGPIQTVNTPASRTRGQIRPSQRGQTKLAQPLKGLPDSIGQVFPAAKVQTCLIHLLRNSFGYASKRHWPEIAVNLRPVYEAPHPGGGRGSVRGVRGEAFEEFAEKWGKAYPAMIRLWRNAWTEPGDFMGVGDP